MRTNFYPIKQLNAGLAALGAAGPVGVALGAAQTAVGIVQAISGGAKTNRLKKQRKAYQTPEEIFKMAQAATSRASGGYDPSTLDYLTGQTDRSFSSSISAATQYGADPNDLSRILDQKIQSTFRIGAENQLQNMKNFQGYLDAMGLVAENKAAEQKSQQDILKDDIQAASTAQQTGFQNILGGAGTVVNTLSSAKTAGLYADRTKAIKSSVPEIVNSVTGTPGYRVPIPDDYYIPRVPESTEPGINRGRVSTNSSEPSLQELINLWKFMREGGE